MKDDAAVPDIPPAENFDMSLTKYDYFHGLLPREDVASLLTKDGDFLLRLSEADTLGMKLETVLSVLHDPKSRCRKEATEGREDFIMHIIIQYAKKKYFILSYRRFNTVPELISYYQKHMMIFRSQQVRLKQPIYLASWEYLSENIQLEDLIAKFGGGEVRKGRLLSKENPPMIVAIKTVAGRSLEAKEKVQELMRECRLLRDLNHPCITQNYGVCLISQPHCFILEYVEGGPLSTYLRHNKDNLRRDDLLMMVSCAGWGLEYLHKNTILHRDVAAKNCLYDKQFVKLIGFSMSKRATVYSMKTARRLAIRWMAPETIETFQYTQKSDVYGFGILIYEIFSAKEPYEGLSNWDAKPLILEGNVNEFTGNTPRKLSEVVRDKMWAKSPDSRSTMQQERVQ
ncbi:SH2 domain protein [Ancylostoma ceylanicum]|uniref:Tyrosine-protein kinase n=1 Tax=Ancylostoma ceylanicum TaxID=53326 RepID=A0A0D6M4G6_9BILA|nr:SH2 domain protein [Ancylostoma ceylanicum]